MKRSEDGATYTTNKTLIFSPNAPESPKGVGKTTPASDEVEACEVVTCDEGWLECLAKGFVTSLTVDVVLML